jgi:hypothetical protein
MRSIAIGLAAALFAVALSPVAAYAADKPAKPADIAADPKKHDQGMKETPPLVQSTGINCTVTDALFMGQAPAKDAAGKDIHSKYYEVACQQGLGYVLQAPDSGDAAAFDCLAMSRYKPKEGEPDKGQIYCRLAPNVDPLKGIEALMTKAAPGCSVSQATYMGASAADKVDQYEVGCASGDAYILQDPRIGSSKTLVAANCLALDPGQCPTYLPKDKYTARISAMAAPSGRQCQVTDGRYIGTSASNKHTYYEVACSDEKAGFVLEMDPTNKYAGSIDCARASSIGSGCTLTSAAAAQTAENATYSKLAQSIGYPCNVKAYHSFGQDQETKREVVELACEDRPDGVIALLPVDTGQKGEYFNCVRAELRGLKCALTPTQATYARVSSQISAAGKSCQVSNARAVGKANDGAEFIEVACTGGGGQMVEYVPNSEKVKSVTPCAQAAGIGGGCKLGK